MAKKVARKKVSPKPKEVRVGEFVIKKVEGGLKIRAIGKVTLRAKDVPGGVVVRQVVVGKKAIYAKKKATSKPKYKMSASGSTDRTTSTGPRVTSGRHK